MRIIGTLLILASFLAIVVAYEMSIAVFTEHNERIINIGLVSNRELTFQFGCVLAITGTLFFGFGEVAHRIALNSPTPVVFPPAKSLPAINCTRLPSIESSPDGEKMIPQEPNGNDVLVRCSECGKDFIVQRAHIGRIGVCARCHAKFTIKEVSVDTV